MSRKLLAVMNMASMVNVLNNGTLINVVNTVNMATSELTWQLEYDEYTMAVIGMDFMNMANTFSGRLSPKST